MRSRFLAVTSLFLVPAAMMACDSGGGESGGSSSTSSGTSSSGTSGTSSSGSGTSSSGAASSSGATSSGSSSGKSSSSGSSTSSSGSSKVCGTSPVIADFESGKDINNANDGRSGAWSNYNSKSNAAPKAPGAIGADGTFPTATPGLSSSKGTLHFADSGYLDYCGFGAPLAGTGNYTAFTRTADDVSCYDGVKFDIQVGSTTGSSQGAVYFEVLTAESQPTTASGTATNAATDLYNTRGYLLGGVGSSPTGTSIPLTTSTQTVYIPFAHLMPRWFPAPGAKGCGSAMCEAPAFNPAHALGLQFSVYPTFSTTGAYDLSVDNVSFYSGDDGLTPPGMTMPTFNDGKTGWKCGSAAPTFAGGKKAMGKYIAWAYHNWKKNFVANGPGAGQLIVKSPDVQGGSVVSEGIAYGMLISVYMNDRETFDGLSKYWLAHPATGTTALMTWIFDITGANAKDQGSATDADEDAAFAFVEAGKRWGQTYEASAAKVIGEVWSYDIDKSSYLPTYGNNAKNNTSNQPTNPSYFAPAFYRIFATAGSQSGFNTVATNVYTALNNVSANSLPPAWCQGNCTSAGGGGYTDNTAYQYDAHRVPWRIGLDYCWNGTAAAATYLDHISATFSTAAASGIDSLADLYTQAGAVCKTCVGTPAPNSMSLIGTAGVGAMASTAAGGKYSPFVNAAWQFVIDGQNRAMSNVLPADNAYYTYYNATVGLLSLITMSGNFYAM